MAIVIAGGLIAAAVYFGSARLGPASPGGAPPAGNQGEEPGAETIGDFRPVTGDDHVRGAQNAKVTIVEYSDLECPFCKTFHPTLQKIVNEYPDDVRWVYRHFPLDVLHSKARKEAEATECAGEQGKFWELADKIFAVTPANNGLNLDDLPKLAREAGVTNIAQFTACLDSGKYAQRVEEDVKDAAVAGGRGTPYSVLIGPDGQKQPLSGAQPYESVKAAVDGLI